MGTPEERARRQAAAENTAWLEDQIKYRGGDVEDMFKKGLIGKALHNLYGDNGFYSAYGGGLSPVNTYDILGGTALDTTTGNPANENGAQPGTYMGQDGRLHFDPTNTKAWDSAGRPMTSGELNSIKGMEDFRGQYGDKAGTYQNWLRQMGMEDAVRHGYYKRLANGGYVNTNSQRAAAEGNLNPFGQGGKPGYTASQFHPTPDGQVGPNPGSPGGLNPYQPYDPYAHLQSVDSNGNVTGTGEGVGQTTNRGGGGNINPPKIMASTPYQSGPGVSSASMPSFSGGTTQDTPSYVPGLTPAGGTTHSVGWGGANVTSTPAANQVSSEPYAATSGISDTMGSSPATSPSLGRTSGPVGGLGNMGYRRRKPKTGSSVTAAPTGIPGI